MAITDLKYDKVLVTGGAGFIGSHIAEQAVKQGKEVICYDNLIAGKKENVPDGAKLIVGDVTDGAALMEAMNGVDVVFHNAASKCTVCVEDPFQDMITNAWGTYCTAQVAIHSGVKRFVHASTGTVKGNSGRASSFYGVTKQAGEKYLEALSGYFNFKPAILRYHHVYGPRQAGEPNGGVVPIFIDRALAGKVLFVHGDGKQRRHFTHVLDVVEANFRAANMNGCVVTDVANPVSWSITDLVDELERYFPKLCASHIDPKPGDIRRFNIKNQFDLDWIDFKEGMKDLVAQA